MNYVPQTHHRFSRIPVQRRVVITGIGAVCPIGIGIPALWDALLKRRSGIGTITRFDTTDMASTVAGEVKNFDPLRLIEPRMKPKRLSRQTQYAVVSAAEAVRDAALSRDDLNRRRVGVIVGSSTCNVETITESALKMQQKGAANGNAAGVTMSNLQASALAVAELLRLEDAFAIGISTACISGVDAVRMACDLIRSGRFETVICGGTDAPLSLTPMAEFCLAGLSSTRNGDPEHASRPFDRDRDRGVISEGSAIVVVEDYEAAIARGAPLYAEILGEYSAVDQSKDRPGCGLSVCMRHALANAQCEVGEIDYISAWGCGHLVIDRIETEAIKEVFGARAHDVAVGSIKGVTGIPLGAAGVLQLVASAMAHRHDLLPPTANCELGDLDCDLDYISGAPRRVRLRRSLLNSHGLGGSNTCLVLGRITQD